MATDSIARGMAANAGARAEEAYQKASDASIFKNGGHYTFATLPSPSSTTLNYIYTVTDAFTTDARFEEGAGIAVPANQEVAVVRKNSAYKYALYGAVLDYDSLSNKPIINQDLDAVGFSPVSNTYYKHNGASATTYTIGGIYYYDGTSYNLVGEKITVDETPTQSSTNPISSGGVYNVIGNINSILDNINGEVV